MANQQRVRTVHGAGLWQEGPGQQSEDRARDRNLAMMQQQMAQRAAERQAILQGNLALFAQGMQSAGQDKALAASQAEAEAGRAFQGSENMATRAQREKEVLLGQKNADRTFTAEQDMAKEKMSQFDRGLQAEWAAANLQAQGRGGRGGAGGQGAGGAGGQDSPATALAFLENDSIKAGKIDYDSLSAELGKLRMLDPQAAEMVLNYLESPVFKEQVIRGSHAAGKGLRESLGLPGNEHAQNLERGEQEIQFQRIRKLRSLFPAGAAPTGPDTSFLQRPAPAAGPSPMRMPGERDPLELLQEVYAERANNPNYRRAIEQQNERAALRGQRPTPKAPAAPERPALGQGTPIVAPFGTSRGMDAPTAMPPLGMDSLIQGGQAPLPIPGPGQLTAPPARGYTLDDIRKTIMGWLPTPQNRR